MSLEKSASETNARKALIRDQRIEIRTLSRLGLTLQHISDELGFIVSQVQLACARETENPKPRKICLSNLSAEQVDELEVFVRESPENRQMCYLELAMGPFSHWGCCEGLISNVLNKIGYSRCIARKKLPLIVVKMHERCIAVIKENGGFAKYWDGADQHKTCSTLSF